MIVRVRMDAQRRIRIPKKTGIEGESFLLLSLGDYHILFPIPDKKPELDVQGPISDLLVQAELVAAADISERWRRKKQNAD